MSQSQMPSRFQLLDGLRGLAALFVLLRHGQCFSARIGYHSYLAVDFFFLLSGFVLCARYDAELAAGRLSPGRFMALRINRLYPLFLFANLLGCGAALLAFAAHGGQFTHAGFWQEGAPLASVTAAFLFALLLLPSPFMPALYPLNGPGWTIGYELLVNAGFAASFRLPAPRRHWLWLAVFGAAAGYLLATRRFDSGQDWRGALIALARGGCGFTLGVALWRWRKPCKVGPNWLKHGAAQLAIIGLLSGALLLPSYSGFDTICDLALSYTLFPLLILCASYAEPQAVAMRAICRFAGRTSYAVYILQAPLSALVAAVAACYGVRLAANPLTTGMFLLGLLPAAYLADRLIDAPWRQRLQARLSRRQLQT